ACPDTLSCPAGGGPPVDRCCSPAMGLLVFVQQWYPKLGPSDAFTLHGLWPDECNGDQGPRNGCDSRRNYPNLGRIIKNADPDLYTSMTTFWPSYKKNVELFWSHEWNKHGTCVSTLEPQCLSETAEPHTDVLVYFRTALALREQFNPYKVLADKNIVPGNLYDRELITTTLQEAWGVPVRITCRRGQINEIWLWMKVRGRDHYIATPPVKPSKAQECGSSIYYPPK
ncbi:RNase Sy, partial [Thamnocephalis sphaerospora]